MAGGCEDGEWVRSLRGSASTPRRCATPEPRGNLKRPVSQPLRPREGHGHGHGQRRLVSSKPGVGPPLVGRGGEDERASSVRARPPRPREVLRRAQKVLATRSCDASLDSTHVSPESVANGSLLLSQAPETDAVDDHYLGSAERMPLLGGKALATEAAVADELSWGTSVEEGAWTTYQAGLFWRSHSGCVVNARRGPSTRGAPSGPRPQLFLRGLCQDAPGRGETIGGTQLAFCVGDEWMLQAAQKGSQLFYKVSGSHQPLVAALLRARGYKPTQGSNFDIWWSTQHLKVHRFRGLSPAQKVNHGEQTLPVM
jgi:hypothetical protein